MLQIYFTGVSSPPPSPTQPNPTTHSHQRGMVFLFFGYHIQNCRSSEKIGRKEMILRFFFPSGFGTKKKNRWEKSRGLILTGRGFFQVVGFRSNFVNGFFFGRKSRGKKKQVKSSVRKEGRRTYVITKKKKPYPFVNNQTVSWWKYPTRCILS